MLDGDSAEVKQHDNGVLIRKMTNYVKRGKGGEISCIYFLDHSSARRFDLG
jgi:hypothetical protein